MGHALAQTNQLPDLSGLQWVSQSKTVAAYREKYPQFTNFTDERLVIAIGTKFPETLKLDSVFANEFYNLKFTDCPAEPDDQLTTRHGTVYRGVKVIRADPEGLTISCTNSAGLVIQRLKFDDLSAVLQKKYNFDPERAAQFRLEEAQASGELQQRLTADGHIATRAQNMRADEGVVAYQEMQQQKIERQEADAQAKAAEAAQKQADAAMLEALKPPPQVNMQQNTIVY